MPTLDDQIKADAMEAMKFTRKFFVVELDFSEGSLKELEGLFEQVDYALPGGRTSENIDMLTRLWGSYLGEVLRRSCGGDWIQDEQQRIALCGKQTRLYPHQEVRQRLAGAGEAASLWRYFQQGKKLL